MSAITDLSSRLGEVINTLPIEQAGVAQGQLTELAGGIGSIAVSTHSGSGLETGHNGILAALDKLGQASEALNVARDGLNDYLAAIGAGGNGQSEQTPVGIERPARPVPTRVNKLEVLPDGSTKTSPASPEISQIVLDHLRQLRQQAREIIPNRPEPPEVERINRFFEKQGLSTAPVVILTPDEVITVRNKLAAIGFSDKQFDELGKFDAKGAGSSGVYVPLLDTCFVVREPRHQKASPEFLSTVAHEKAHSTSLHTDLECTESETGDIGYNSSRVGHLLASRLGAFLEEGYACFMAAKFVREELGLPNGMWPNGSVLDIQGLPLMPSVYAWLNEQGYLIMSPGAPAAYALELLAEQRLPDLPASLIKARSSAEGLREVEAAIESVEPGLYGKLCDLPDDELPYAKGYYMIRWALNRPGVSRNQQT
ncbi:MAG TPA: hypothetical protein VMR45_04805 [Patescibacteria group bacterium]|nr:hypothetical protein [Patescibacteria group bacterium]